MNKIILGMAVALLLLAGAGLASMGAATPSGTLAATPSIVGPSVPAGSVQDVSVRALSNGRYDKAEITVKKGTPVRFSFSADPGAGCGRALYITDFGVKLVSYSGETDSATFTPDKTGDFAYRCGMNMFRGVMHVVD